MSKAIGYRDGLGNEADLTTPTSTQVYPLGYRTTIYDSATKMEKEFIYVKSHAGLTQYQPYVLNWTGTAGSEVKTAAPATTAAPGQMVCVPQVAFTSGYYGFVQIKGDCTCLLANETKAVGDYLQVLNTGTTLVVDGTSSSTVLLGNSCAVSKSATTDGTSGVAIILIGKWAVTAAS